MEELELIKRRIGKNTIRLTMLNIASTGGYIEFIPVNENKRIPCLRIKEIYPFNLYIEPSDTLKGNTVIKWCSTKIVRDNVVRLIREENNFSDIKDLIDTVKQYLCKCETEYEVLSSLADLKKDRTASVAVILRDDITVTVKKQ